ncbi:DUF6233 domain-containing protein [Streptomyces sp. YIM S03343]
MELGIGVGRPPTQVHRGTCHLAGKRRRPVGQEEARRLLADGTGACTHCRPDTDLGITGLAPEAGHASRPSGRRGRRQADGGQPSAPGLG